ncbi:hypothetical protein QBC40DRAFT_9479 [Triangularia verruculosa]|uniref:Uncharacterized protein n=1 Tax=Triangularia verruculosa TaxID=2587418 RepID=A0AAN7ASY3_9PEZI|nr:hypothetical protein QBC40DRAFT_9479 [Triangularia verruculosa]
MSSNAHPHGRGNGHVPLAAQPFSEDNVREAHKNMMATLDRVRQTDMRKVRDDHAAEKAALEQDVMECTQQFFQLQQELAVLTQEDRSVDVNILDLEELLKRARQKKQDVLDRIARHHHRCAEVQTFQRSKHAELQALTKEHNKALLEKEKTWEQLYQQRLNLRQSRIPASIQQVPDHNAIVPDQAKAEAAASASLPMHSLKAPQLTPGLGPQSAGQGDMFVGGPVQSPVLKAPTDNGPRDPTSLPASKRLGAPVLEAPTLASSNGIESQRVEGAFRPSSVQRTPILQAPLGYQPPPPPQQRPKEKSSVDTLVFAPPTVVPSVERPDEQTATPMLETQDAAIQPVNHHAPEQAATSMITSAANGAPNNPPHLQSSEETVEINVSDPKAMGAQETTPGAFSAVDSASEKKGSEDVEMNDAALPQATAETHDVLAANDAGVSISESPVRSEIRGSKVQPADVEMADSPIVEGQSEMSPTTPVVGATTTDTGPYSAQADAGPLAQADTADSPLSDLSSISSPPSDTFIRAESPDGQLPTLVDGKLCVYNEQGTLVGVVPPLTHTTSPNIEKIAAIPLKRPVQIRSGRKFSSEDLKKVYHNSDAKGTKWTSLYIQATGEVQTQPCNTCAKHNGPYEECIILDADDSFPKCGNCEWNRHACLGASLRPETASGPAPEPTPTLALAEDLALAPTSASAPTAIGKPPFGSGFTAVNSPSVEQQDNDASPKDVPDPARSKDVATIKKPSRKSLPTSRVQLPSQPGTPRPGSPETAPDDAPLPEITKENLCLRDDGTVYTDPPFMAGVPLVKISPDHPYWEHDWDPDIASHIRKDLEKWTARFQEMDSQGVKDHRKYEAQRQINRGQLTLRFLEEGELHPYQLVGKAWMEPKKIIKYNTLYRLASTLMEDLPKFDLGMAPAEWMRHRLYEIYQEEGATFNLASTVASFYHDPKHAQVRTKSGYVSVGRPHKSASRPKVQASGQEDGTPKQAPRVLKRKEPHSTPKTTAGLSKQEEANPGSQLLQQQQESELRPRSSPRKPTGGDHKARPRSRSGNPPPAPVVDLDDEERPIRTAVSTPPAPAAPPKKKIRVTSTVDPSMTPDLQYQGFTDVDSCSDDRLERIDWRVNQIKTSEVSTNPNVTQYWHWVDDTEPGFCEHQVLKQLRPPKWAVFKEPYNFHIIISECEEIVYGPGSLRVIIRRNKKVDMLAEFKRERTKKRFLEFMHQRGLRIVRSNKEYVDSEWVNLEPAFNMPGQEEDRDSD